jgi:hypothetical protein
LRPNRLLVATEPNEQRVAATAGFQHAARTAVDELGALSTSPAADPISISSVVSTAGSARSRTVASVITPSVPHEPVMSLVRSKPATFFTTRPPPRTTLPVPLTNSTPSVTSRGEPKW